MANGFDPRLGARPSPATTFGRDSVAVDAGLRSYMLSVYNYMASGVLLTGIVALLFARSGAVMSLYNLNGSRLGLNGLGWIVMLSPLAVIMVLSFGINRLSTGAAQALYWVYAALMGLSLSTIFLVYTGAFDRDDLLRDVRRLPQPQPVGLYDEAGPVRLRHLPADGRDRPDRRDADQRLLPVGAAEPGDQRDRRAALRGPHRLRHAEDQEHVLVRAAAPSSPGKSAIMGALKLYLDFINMFLFLLRFMGDRR